MEEVVKLGSFWQTSKAGRVQLFSVGSMGKVFPASIWLVMLIVVHWEELMPWKTLLFSVIALTVEDMFDEEEVMTFFELRDIIVEVQKLTGMVLVEILLDFEVFEILSF